MHWRHCVTMVGLIALASGMAAPARAADKVEAGAHGEASTAMKFTIGPPSAWVLPATIPAPPAAAHGASTISLLSDSQVRFTPEGSINFANSIYSIETAQGLDEGAIQVGWDPALEKLIVHHIRLIRAGQTIDLLGDGSKLPVMRREKNLEKATIDGRLTILVQPDDLRVGDIVDYSYTRTRLDPAQTGQGAELIVVEPDRAACLLLSAAAGQLTADTGPLDTIMAGLACGEPSLLAWQELDRAAAAFLAITDDAAVDAMRLLARHGIVSGESGAAGLAGLLAAAADGPAREALRLDASSRVLLFSTEGATDPALYDALVGAA